MNAAAMISRMAISRETIAAIIRKDLRTLWPFALTLAVLLLVMQAFFRVTADYPDVMLDFGQSQLHVAPAMFIFHAFGMPIVVATFIVMLVQQDPATDARNDWMARPISALDLVAAKALVILAVVLIPSSIGSFAYVTTHNLSIGFAIGPIMLMLIGCIFMLVVAWLSSGPVQALLAPLVLAVATLLTILSLGLTIGMGVVDIADQRDMAAEFPKPAAPVLVLPRAPPPPEAPAMPSPQAAPDDARPATESPPAQVEALQGRRLGAQAAPREAVSGAVRFIERPRRAAPVIDLTWSIVITEFLLILGAAGVVLWLLLARRKLAAARMTFLGFFGAAVLLMLLQGSVSTPRDEMIAFQQVTTSLRPPPPEAERFAAFQKHDSNGDQKLDKTEYAAVLDELGFSGQLESLWMQRDDNVDGFVTAEEYRAVIPAAPGGPPAPDPQRFAAFTKNDANKDGRLDPAEYRAVLSDLGFSEQFATLWMQRDGNADGFISAEEYGMPAQ